MTNPASDGKKRKKLALGRGLDALIPSVEEIHEAPEKAQADFFQCAISAIRPNPFQPRVRFSDEELSELSASIREQGVLQPLLIRKTEGGYELIAGERRLRAAKKAGLEQVPVVVKDISDANVLEVSLVENIQREDLNPLEEAEAYYLLTKEFDLSHDEVARRVGKNRSTITNFIRLRQLPEEIRQSLSDNRLSMGHARALLAAETQGQQMKVWRTIMEKGISVRETEGLIKRLKEGKKKKPDGPSPEQHYYTGIAENLSRQFGTKVQIKRRGKKGKVEIEFYTDDDLKRLLDLIGTE